MWVKDYKSLVIIKFNLEWKDLDKLIGDRQQSRLDWREKCFILITKEKYYLPLDSQTNSDFVHDIIVDKKKWCFKILHWCYYDLCTLYQRT